VQCIAEAGGEFRITGGGEETYGEREASELAGITGCGAFTASPEPRGRHSLSHDLG